MNIRQRRRNLVVGGWSIYRGGGELSPVDMIVARCGDRARWLKQVYWPGDDITRKVGRRHQGPLTGISNMTLKGVAHAFLDFGLAGIGLHRFSDVRRFLGLQK